MGEGRESTAARSERSLAALWLMRAKAFITQLLWGVGRG
jgi:hypothetical protein